MADMQAALRAELNAVAGGLKQNVRYYAWAETDFGGDTLPGMPGTPMRAVYLSMLSHAIVRAMGVNEIDFSDTSIELVNKIGGSTFDCFVMVTAETEKVYLEHQRFTHQDEHEWTHRLTLPEIRMNVSDGKLADKDTDYKFTRDCVVDLAWYAIIYIMHPHEHGQITYTCTYIKQNICIYDRCAYTEEALLLTSLFKSKKWAIGPHDGKTRMLVYVRDVNGAVSITVKDAYAAAVGKHYVAPQFAEYGQRSTQFDRVNALTEKGSLFSVVLKVDGPLHGVMPAGGRIWNGLAFEGQAPTVCVDYRPADLGDRHRYEYICNINICARTRMCNVIYHFLFTNVLYVKWSIVYDKLEWCHARYACTRDVRRVYLLQIKNKTRWWQVLSHREQGQCDVPDPHQRTRARRNVRQTAWWPWAWQRALVARTSQPYGNACELVPPTSCTGWTRTWQRLQRGGCARSNRCGSCAPGPKPERAPPAWWRWSCYGYRIRYKRVWIRGWQCHSMLIYAVRILVYACVITYALTKYLWGRSHGLCMCREEMIINELYWGAWVVNATYAMQCVYKWVRMYIYICFVVYVWVECIRRYADGTCVYEWEMMNGNEGWREWVMHGVRVVQAVCEKVAWSAHIWRASRSRYE